MFPYHGLAVSNRRPVAPYQYLAVQLAWAQDW
jgi:hypothetical protein